MESAVGRVAGRVLGHLDGHRRAGLLGSPTLDLDATDGEVYGSRTSGIAYKYKGQRAGRPHLVTWAEAGIVLAADLLAGEEDPGAGVVVLLDRALAGLAAATDPHGGDGRVRIRADIGHFTEELADAVVAADADFAIGANRNPATWRAAAAVPEHAWVDADGMDGAQVAVADHVPAGWPAGTRCLIRGVRHEAAAISADPRARRRRTIPADQLALALGGALDQVWAYSFIVTNLDTSTAEQARTVESWYRHRTDIEDRIRDAKHGAALRHLPSGNLAVNTSWMWGSLLRSTCRPGSTNSPDSTTATVGAAPTSVGSDANSSASPAASSATPAAPSCESHPATTHWPRTSAGSANSRQPPDLHDPGPGPTPRSSAPTNRHAPNRRTPPRPEALTGRRATRH